MLGIVLCTGCSDTDFYAHTFGCSLVGGAVKHLNVMQKLFSNTSGNDLIQPIDGQEKKIGQDF